MLCGCKSGLEWEPFIAMNLSKHFPRHFKIVLLASFDRMSSYTTIDVESGGVVVDPDNVFSQAGVVTRVIQTNPLNMKTAVPPHCHILVCGHLEAQEG